MIRFATFVLLSASAALAFTPTHRVIADGAVLYDEDHNYDDNYIIERLPYWTPVVAEEVGPPDSPRTYCLATLADGRRGLTEWDNLGRALEVIVDEVTLAGVPAGVPPEAAEMKRGDQLAFAPPSPKGERPGFVEVVNADGLRGWVPEDAVAPTPEEGD
jgi:hypothetical protein